MQFVKCELFRMQRFQGPVDMLLDMESWGGDGKREKERENDGPNS